MDKNIITERIKGLKAEQASLQSTHETMVRHHQEATQKFEQQVQVSRTRFAQIQGAIAELERLANSADGELPVRITDVMKPRSTNKVKQT